MRGQDKARHTEGNRKACRRPGGPRGGRPHFCCIRGRSGCV